MRIIAGLVASNLMIISSFANAEPIYRLNNKQNSVLELSNLYLDKDCHPSQITGRIVKRSFDETGIWVRSITVEERDGSRTLINVDSFSIEVASRVALGWTANGLQKLAREGRQVSLGVKLCGASGSVIMLDSIK